MDIPIRKYEEGTAAVGYGGEGVGKDGSNDAGMGDDVQVSGSDSASF